MWSRTPRRGRRLGATVHMNARGSSSEVTELLDRRPVYGVSGRRAAGIGPARAPADVQAVLRSGRPVQHAGDGPLVAVAPLYRGERVAGAVRAQRDDGRAARETRRAWLLLGAVALAIVLLAVVAAVILGRR